MRLGVDFDNTIVAYDEAFRSAARQRGIMPVDASATKESMRDWLRAAGREGEWTELQGYVYGPGIGEAQPFPGVCEFFERCAACDVEIVIVSHKTRRPYAGPPHDLHDAARDWLHRHGLGQSAYFEPTKESKLERIGALACDVFVDDLPEFLLDPAFPSGVRRVCFDPHASAAVTSSGLDRLRSWADGEAVLLER